MPTITAKSIEFMCKLSTGELGVQGAHAWMERQSENHSSRHLERYFFPTTISAVLYLSKKMPISTTSRLAHTFSHIVTPLVYTTIKDKALEEHQIPDPMQEMGDGAVGGATAGAVDCLLRRIRPFCPNPALPFHHEIPGFFSHPAGFSCPPGFLPYPPPKLLPATIRGGAAGVSFVVGSLIADKWIKRD